MKKHEIILDVRRFIERFDNERSVNNRALQYCEDWVYCWKCKYAHDQSWDDTKKLPCEYCQQTG